MSKEKDEILSLTEAAGVVGVSRQRLWVVIKNGQLNANQVGHMWTVMRSDAEEYRDADRPTGIYIGNRG